MSADAAATAPAPGAVTGPQIRRRAAALQPKKEGAESTGGSASSNTMMRLYTADDNPGLKIDPVIVLSLAVVFVFSVVFLHLFTRFVRWYSK
ncbi:hypothetical protein RQP46_006400 [Phenoliferia psychrophenolica]